MKIILRGERLSPPPFRWKSKPLEDVFFYDIYDPRPTIESFTFGSSFDIMDDEDGLTPYGYIHLDYEDGAPIRARVKKDVPYYLNPITYAPYPDPVPNSQLFYKVLRDFATFLYSRFSSRIIFFELTPF